MTRPTRFRPRLDGFRFEAEPVLSAEQGEEIRSAFRAAWRGALERLAHDFGRPILDLYGVERLERWVGDERASAFGTSRGAVFAALDYFHARRLWPPRSLDHPVGDGQGGNRARLRDYVFRRALDGLGESAVSTLHRRALLHLIPATWLPAEWLLRPVRARTVALAVSSTLGLELGLRAAGGTEGLCELSAADWKMLRPLLDAGTPAPIGFIERESELFETRYAVATAYVPGWAASGLLTLVAYDPGRPRRECRIEVPLAPSGAAVPAGAGARRVEGMFCESYVAKRPPASPGGRVLDATRLRYLLWPLLRAIRRLVSFVARR